MTKVSLKNYANDAKFISKMNLAFSDLRADYELTMDANNEKINELSAIHVDIKNQLANLRSYSLNSSGVISGLRGTGKTHLMLLARHEINKNCFYNNKDGVLCIYLNVKRLNLPQKFNQEIFNRIFSIFIYDAIAKQLSYLLNSSDNDSSFLCHLIDFFKGDEKKFKEKIKSAICKIVEFSCVAQKGNSKYENLDYGSNCTDHKLRETNKNIISLFGKLSRIDQGLSANWGNEKSQELFDSIKEENIFLQYLNISKIREEIIELIRILGLKGITFYVDEWEKISYDANIQEFMAFYIDRILDDPIYFWISMVPNRGSLYTLDRGADLQHLIDLDENLVFENSKIDQDFCLDYFKKFIDKRLAYYFNDEDINYSLFFNEKKKLEMLVLASMGNSRDFGTMLLHSWSAYCAYREKASGRGRPYQYICVNMVIDAIKNDGKNKLSNIERDQATLEVWQDLECFCVSKRSSHFAIEENRANSSALSHKEFSNLIYHRLLHLRKKHVQAKDTTVEGKLSIYALNYSSTYNLFSNKKIEFVTKQNIIHDRVRRYIYDPKRIISSLQIREGEIFPCKSCGTNIDVKKMKPAWESNSCPYCGKVIH